MTSTNRCRGKGLFLETSAQIERLLGSPGIQQGVLDLCQRFPVVGTSAFVRAEFDKLIGGFMESAADILHRLPDRFRKQSFTEVWREVEGLRPFYYQGKSLAAAFALHMSEFYGKRRVTPVGVARTLLSQLALMRERFLIVGGAHMASSQTVFDRTSCCLWQKGHCDKEPKADCKLHETTWCNRAQFEETVSLLADHDFAESDTLRKKLPRLKIVSESLDYLGLIASGPNAFGDILIFNEVPEGWSMLTKDHAFPALQAGTRRDVEVLMVRLPRQRSSEAVELRTDKKVHTVSLENRTARDLGVRSADKIGRRKTQVHVRLDGGWWTGFVTREERDPEANLYHYGIRITGSGTRAVTSN